LYSVGSANTATTLRKSDIYKKVGETTIQLKHRATCHCGSVELQLTLPNGIEKVSRCDCSICRRKGAIVGTIKANAIRVVKGHEVLKLYQFNTFVAKHYFCSNCGIYTHHQRRSDPNEFGYNVGCLEGVNPFDFGEIPTSHGINHPADQGKS